MQAVWAESTESSCSHALKCCIVKSNSDVTDSGKNIEWNKFYPILN